MGAKAMKPEERLAYTCRKLMALYRQWLLEGRPVR